MSDDVISRHLVEVASVREGIGGTYVLRTSRPPFAFQPGQHVRAGLPDRDVREYSVYSAPDDPFIEILVREIPEGSVSPALRRCQPGDAVSLEGPCGEFTLPARSHAGQPCLFVATGTGIAPFHAMIQTYPDLDYLLLHGVRSSADLVDDAHYDPARRVLCVSQGGGGDYHGRVTAYLAQHPVPVGTACFVCGSCDMIYEVFALLSQQGIPRGDIFAETYF